MKEMIAKLEEAIWARQGRREGNEIKFACPSHNDTHPSARWNPEKKVFHCFSCGAGGGWKNLADQLGLSVKDLPANERNPIGDTPVPFLRGRADWRKFSKQMGVAIDAHSINGLKVLGAAKGRNISEWTDSDLSAAMRVVSFAYHDLDVAEYLETELVDYRATKLEQERQRHER